MPKTTPPRAHRQKPDREPARVVDALIDEKLIQFHPCSDFFCSEQAHYAGMVLPDARYLERWGFDNRNSLEPRGWFDTVCSIRAV